MNLQRGMLLCHKHTLRRGVVVYADDRTVILRFGQHKSWTTSTGVVRRNYRIV